MEESKHRLHVCVCDDTSKKDKYINRTECIINHIYSILSIQYKPACMFVALIWYAFLLFLFIYSIFPHIEIGAALWIVFFVIIYMFAVFSYKHVKLSTRHMRNNVNIPLSNLSYVVVDRIQVNDPIIYPPSYPQTTRPTWYGKDQLDFIYLESRSNLFSK